MLYDNFCNFIPKIGNRAENLCTFGCERSSCMMFCILTILQDLKTWKMKVVMEKSWNMKNLPKVMKFCDQ